MKERIGIFGGTFDPPHLGHLILASEALCQLSLDKVLFMLSPAPPHKKELKKSNTEHRLAMLKLMVENDDRLEISYVDINREGPHYTADSLGLLHEEYPEAKIVYLMGADSLQSLFKIWYKPDLFIQRCDEIGVMKRPTIALNINELEKNYQGIGEKISLINAPLLEISSSEIRERIKSGGHFRYYLNAAVYDYIIANQVFGQAETECL